MAGKIIADTLEHSTAGSVTTDYVVNGSAKAWYTLTMTSASLDDSFNCGSVTDIATGRFTVALTNNMSDSNYAVAVSGVSSANNNNGSNRCAGGTSHQSGSAYAVGMVTNGGALNDLANFHQIIAGDLA
jgi:hypothetical protein